ncbi:hypothetical protein [Chamaesiphon sp.]|uniref:hypothetical protein n=1 Tax=Chamaesiphon sp. TaxID=2814140 RepID=UPI0035931C06
MIEKIILAIAITCSLAWSMEVKPPQRVVAIEVSTPIEIASEYRVAVIVTV